MKTISAAVLLFIACSNATDLFTPEPILDTPKPEEVNKDLVLEFFADEKP